jgi:hypothetical protein
MCLGQRRLRPWLGLCTKPAVAEGFARRAERGRYPLIELPRSSHPGKLARWPACRRAASGVEERWVQFGCCRLVDPLGRILARETGRPHLGGAVRDLGGLSWRARSWLTARSGCRLGGRCWANVILHRRGGWAGAFGDVQAVVEAAKRRGGPPVPLSEECHERGDEQGADDERVDQDGGGGSEAEFLEEDDVAGAERAEGDGDHDRAGGDDPSGVLQSGRDGVAFGEAVVVGFLDSGEQEHAVVGGESEDDRGEDEEVGGFDSALA